MNASKLFHGLRSKAVSASEIAIQSPVKIANADRRDPEGNRYTLLEVVHQVQVSGRVIVIQNAQGKVVDIGIENPNPGFDTKGAVYFAQIEKNDPLRQIIEEQFLGAGTSTARIDSKSEGN